MRIDITKLGSEKYEELRVRLLGRLAEIDEERDATSESRAAVELDQQMVGRLSRMDALQHQAMAKATQGRREGERKRIEAALARMDEGEFGFCTACGEEIAVKRLDLDPAMPTCITCARG